MKRAGLVCVLVLSAACPIAAQASGVGLGVSLGAAFPTSVPVDITGADAGASFNWGFYVNIPLIYSFHLTPSSELYKFGTENVTDFDIAFKFIVPLESFNIYAGFSPGLTAASNLLAVHVGVVGGGAIRLVSNLDAFLQVKYVWLFLPSGNNGVVHANAGIILNL